MSSLTSPLSDVQSTPPVHDAGDLIITPDDAVVWDAVKNNQLEVLKELIHVKANIDAMNEGKTLLEEALSHPDLAVVRLLLDAKADTRSCFTRLIHFSNGDALKALIVSNADVNIVVGCRNYSPLHYAVLEGESAATVLMLLEARADLEIRNIFGDTALATAVVTCEPETVKLLIDANASIEAVNDKRETMLMMAARVRGFEMFKLMFDQNPNIDLEMRDSAGNSVLCHAADAGHVEVMSFLLSAKASIDVRNNEGQSPLWLAARSGVVDAVQVLVDTGASLAGTCDNNGNTLICAASQAKGKHEAMLRYLLSANASVHETNHFGQGPLFLEIERHSRVTGAIQCLIAAGAQVNKPDKDGNTPVMVAARMAHVDVLEELIKAKANVNALNNNKESPLLLATKYSIWPGLREEATQLLLDAKADVDMRVFYDKTVLSCVV